MAKGYEFPRATIYGKEKIDMKNYVIPAILVGVASIVLALFYGIGHVVSKVPDDPLTVDLARAKSAKILQEPIAGCDGVSGAFQCRSVNNNWTVCEGRKCVRLGLELPVK